MSGRHKVIFAIPAILLILIFVGMTPLNMAHRLAAGGPFTHCKQVQWSNQCLFNSLVSHGDPTIVTLDVTPLDNESTPAIDIQALDPDSFLSNTVFNSVPLRC